MNINTFLDKYYLSSHKEKIVKLLIDLSAFKDVKFAIENFYSQLPLNEQLKTTALLTLTIRDWTVSINSGLEKLENKKEKEKELIELGIYFIKETFTLSNLTPNVYFDILKQTIKEIYKKHLWDFSSFEKLLNISNLQAFSYLKKDVKNNARNIITSKHLFLEWQSKEITLDFFIDDLSVFFKGIKNKRNLYKLFDKVDDDFKIVLHSKHLIHFLSLFYLLHNSKVIFSKGNRGYFKYLEQHLIPPKNDYFPSTDFRKIRYNAFNSNSKKENILKVLKPIIDKYCLCGQ